MVNTAPGAPRQITLCGFVQSNYYNKVKLVLLEKGVPFDEEAVRPGSGDAALLAASPLGKIPFVRFVDADGAPQALCESQVICEWLETVFPQPPLLPAEALAAARVRELVTFVDLHLELLVRDLYAEAFFGGSVSEGTKERVRKRLPRHVAAFQRLARFAPYIAGAEFTLADCAAFASLPLVGMASAAVLGEDALLAAGVDWKAYTRFIGQRPAAARVVADRKAGGAPAR